VTLGPAPQLVGAGLNPARLHQDPCKQEIGYTSTNSCRHVAPRAANAMLKLTPPPNLKDPRSGTVNLRPGGSAPNFAPPRHLRSDGFFANLKFVLTHRHPKTPADSKETTFRQHHFRASFIDNLLEHFRPAPKLTGQAVASVRGAASPGIKIESQPLFLSLLINIRDAIFPPKLPPLQLTSKPIEVPEIWSKPTKLSAARVVSVILHVSFAALVLTFGYHEVTNLDPAKPVTTVLIAPPAPGAAAPPPPAPAAPAVTHRPTSIKRKSFFVQGKLTAPTSVPKVANAKPAPDNLSAPDVGVDGGVPGGSPGGVLGGVLGGTPGGIPGGIPGGTGVAPAPPGPATTKPGIVRVGGDVKRPKVISAPPLEYPALAERAGITGVVVLDAIIDEHGNVVNLRVVSGNGMLINAALKAVKQWKFEPSYLNGVPVSVQLEVDVSFHPPSH
jgi:protein TonB